MTRSDAFKNFCMLSMHVVLLEVLEVRVADLIIAKLDEHLNIGAQPAACNGLVSPLQHIQISLNKYLSSESLLDSLGMDGLSLLWDTIYSL